MGALRTIPAIFRATAGLNAEELALLDVRTRHTCDAGRPALSSSSSRGLCINAKNLIRSPMMSNTKVYFFFHFPFPPPTETV